MGNVRGPAVQFTQEKRKERRILPPLRAKMMMSSRSIRSPVSCNAVNKCFICHPCPSRNFYQHSHTLKLQRMQVGQMFLPRKLKKSIQWQTTFFSQRHIVSQYSSDHSTSCKKRKSNSVAVNVLQDQPNTRCGTLRKVLVILNPYSGYRSSREVFYKQVQSIFNLSGFEMEVVETAYAGHAKVLASTVDLSTCPNGIICVGGDGIVNEVLNGLLSRDDLMEAIQLPIGIIPAGSDNSLVWSVLGIREPVSAAMTIAKGGSTPIDVFAVKWIQAGVTHFGLTASYYGFVTDVLQLSENFRLQLGPFRYFIAGLLKFLSLPQYRFEVDYLPLAPERNPELKSDTEQNRHKQSGGTEVGRTKEINNIQEEKWIARNGEFLGIFVCNHICKPAQGLFSPVIAPKAQQDDRSLDLLLVHGSGRLRLFCFFVAYQFCWHLLLPFVEYVKVKSVKIRPVGNTHNSCGVDGELLLAEGQAEWQCSLLPAQGRLLGQRSRDNK